MKNIARVFAIAVAVCAIPFAAIAADGSERSKTFRLIPIPKRAYGYGRMDSVVIRTKAELDGFLKGVPRQGGWNNRKGFEDAIGKAKVDFGKEALVLLCHAETSGSVQVTFRKPTLRGRRLTCRIAREVPEIGTADMAYYCFALAVSKSDVSKVELQVAGRKSIEIELPVVEEQSNKPGGGDGE